MGEAARRKKLDANYGKIPSLRTPEKIANHAALIIEELFGEFKEVLKNAIVGKTEAENYQSESEKIQGWLEKKFLSYREQERSLLAKHMLLIVFDLMGEPVENEWGNISEISPMLMLYMLKANQKYLTYEENEKMLLELQKLVEQGRKLGLNSCDKFLTKKIAEELELLAQ